MNGSEDIQNMGCSNGSRGNGSGRHQQRGRLLVQRDYEQLSEESSEDYPDFQYDEEDEVDNIANVSIQNQTGIRWEFRNDTWKNPNIMYDPMSMPFSGLGKGPTFIYNSLPNFITLFELFWTPVIIDAIVRETNRYATALDSLGRTCRGPNWE